MFLVGCDLSEPELESLVGVPGTVSEARALHDPPDVAVTVTRRNDVSFSPEIDEVVIRERGVDVVWGEWAADGELIWAERRDGRTLRAVRIVELPALGRRFIAETASAALRSDDTPGEWTPSPLAIDLRDAYLEAKGADALIEAIDVLKGDGIAIVVHRLPSEDDGVREAVIERACDDPRARGPILTAAAAVAGPKAAAAGLECSLEMGGPAATFATVLADALCVEPDAVIAADLASFSPRIAGMVDASTCASAAGRALVMRVAGQAPTREVLVAGMRDAGIAADLLAACLDPRDPVDRAALFAGLSVAETAGPVVERLALALELRFTAEEGEALARAYVAEPPAFLGGRSVQATMLALLTRVEEPVRALAVLAGEDPVRTVGRHALGDAAARGALPVGVGRMSPGEVWSVDELVGYGLSVR